MNGLVKLLKLRKAATQGEWMPAGTFLKLNGFQWQDRDFRVRET